MISIFGFNFVQMGLEMEMSLTSDFDFNGDKFAFIEDSTL